MRHFLGSDPYEKIMDIFIFILMLHILGAIILFDFLVVSAIIRTVFS